jgi:hypothetical protein
MVTYMCQANSNRKKLAGSLRDWIHVNCTVDSALDELQDDMLCQVVASGLEVAGIADTGVAIERDDKDDSENGFRLAPGQISFCFSKRSSPFKE